MRYAATLALNGRGAVWGTLAAKSEVLTYRGEGISPLSVMCDGETVWLTQQQMAALFRVQKAAISKHVKNIFAIGELDKRATVSKMETVQSEGGRSIEARGGGPRLHRRAARRA